MDLLHTNPILSNDVAFQQVNTGWAMLNQKWYNIARFWYPVYKYATNYYSKCGNKITIYCLHDPRIEF